MNRETAPERTLSTECDKKWHIAFVASTYTCLKALENPEKRSAGKNAIVDELHD
jgi:hypothetical protein